VYLNCHALVKFFGISLPAAIHLFGFSNDGNTAEDVGKEIRSVLKRKGS
jgi:hypothetical protein